jgi:phosphatidylethanolamine-binding protein (PEBP) family uncharacterized protein
VTPPAKCTSAGLCLALVLAGLLLGGCGGGSPDPQADSTTQSSTPAAAPSGPAGSAAGGGHASQQGAGPGQQTAEKQHSAEQQGGSASAEGDGQKHGPRIAQPKGQREQAPSAAEKANLTIADMSLASPSLPAGPGGPVPLTAPYTCDGAGKWPALSWSGVPGGTRELVLYAMNLAPVEGKLFVDWAVAGIDPALTGIEAAKLPKGVVVGTNGFGKRDYEICPEGSETYVFAIYALPRALSPKPGFDAREFRKALLGVSGDVGLLSVAYARS